MELNKKKLLFIFCLLLIAIPVSFASDNNTDYDDVSGISGVVSDSKSVSLSNDNCTIGKISNSNSEILGDDDYTYVYFDASVGESGDGSQSNPYKDLSQISVIGEKSIYYFAGGNYSTNDLELFVFSDVIFVGEDVENTIIDFNGYDICIMEYEDYGTPALSLCNLTLNNTSISALSGFLYCENVIFQNCEGYISTGDGQTLGGAIYSGVDVVLNHCYFINNYADYGGAIFISDTGSLTCYDSYFSYNSANNTGVISSYGDIRIFNSIFETNYADSLGGVIYSSGYLYISGSSFYENYDYYGYAGVIYSSNNVDIENSVFEGNFAYSNYAGSIFMDNSNTLLNISNSNFTGNFATYGGVIYSYSNITLINSNFKDNFALNNSGVIYTYFSSDLINIISSNFTNNAANYGAVVCVSNNNTVVNISDSCFSNNIAYCGGVIYSNNIVKMNKTKFLNNSAYSGGAIYSLGEVIGDEVYFSNNYADYGGGAIYMSSSSNLLNLSDSTFIGNNAYSGGALYSNIAFNLSNANFTYNSADYGGAIYTLADTKLSYSNFTHNSANMTGGAIYSMLTLVSSNSNFTNNSATYGGAIYSNGNINVTETEFLNNNASSGGAIYAEGILNVVNSVFKNNYAVSGGAVYSLNDMAISTSLFLSNRARGGGAINTNASLFVISNSNFTGNSANYGGAIASNNANNFTLTNSNFKSNIARGSGGAVYSLNNLNYFYSSNFTYCVALFGGAICDLNSTSRIYNSKFSSNNATYQGGAIYKMYNEIYVDDSEFLQNNASGGGAIYIDNISSIDLSATFENNAAQYGGDIYSLANSITFGSSIDVYEVSYMNLTRSSTDYITFKINKTSPDIPSRYDLREHNLLTDVKDQEAEGNCWAFAAIAALESCILKANGTVYDFSEENLKNLMAIFSDVGNLIATNNGGNALMASGYFASWLGPVYENMDNYSSDALSPILNEVTHIQNIIFTPRNSYTDNDAIKEAILKYGAVATSICYEDSFRNTETQGYFVPIEYTTNHAVTIVGWDDNYSKDNFLYTPEGDGAFIVRNSWGPDWGEDGYFYVSYYDRSIAGMDSPFLSYTFILNDTNHYDKNYQHETQIGGGIINSTYIKTRYVAESDELLSAFSTYFYDKYDWEASIYVNDELKDSLSGTSGIGYYTIPLNRDIPIKEGDVFEIVLKISSPDGSPTNAIYVFMCENNPKIDYEGVSFTSPSGTSWADTYSAGYIVAIKAFTKYGRLNTSLTVEGLDIDWNIFKSSNIKVTVKDQYGNLINDGKIIFSIDGENYTVDVVDGIAEKILTFDNAGNHNITILFKADQYYASSNITEIIYVNPLSTATGISLSSSNVLVGESLTIEATVNVTSGKILFYINNILNDTVDVDSNGKAQLILNNLVYGNYNVTVNYTDSNGNYLNSSNKTSFSVSKKQVTLDASDIEIFYGEQNTLNVIVKYNNEVISDVDVKIDELGNKTTNTDGEASFDLSLLAKGEYTFTIKVNTSTYVGEKQITVNIKPASTTLNIELSNNEFIVGDTVTVTAHVNASEGSISFYINGILNETITVDSNGNASVTLTNLVYGDYNISANFTDDNYLNSSDKTTFKVSKKEVTIIIDDLEFDYKSGSSLEITVKYQNELLANLDITVNGENKTTDNGGKVTLSLNDLNKDNYIYTVKVNTLQYIGEKEVTVIINAVKTLTALSLSTSSLVVGDSVTVTAHVNATEGIVNFYVNGVLNETKSVDSEGNAYLTLTNLVYGNYIVSANFTADNYLNSSEKTSFSVDNKDLKIDVSDLTVNYGDETSLVITLTSANNPIADLSVSINGENKTTDAHGQILIPLGGLNHGEHSIIVKVNISGYVGEKTVTVTVNPVNTALIIELTDNNILVGDSVTVTANVNAIEGSVLFYVNGVLNKTCDVNSASLTLTDIAYGNYIVSANFTDVDGNYLNSSNWTSFNVVKKEVIVGVDDLVVDYASDSQLVIIVSYQNDLLANLNITVNGVNKTTDAEGKVIIDLNNLAKGEYPFSVKVNTSEYIGEKTITVTVNPVNTLTKITLSDDSFVTGGSITITADVNATEGSVLFYVNGVLNKTCDVNSASLTLNNLVYGNYIVSANFTDANGNYLNSSNETGFFVSNKNLNIDVSDLTINYGDETSLVITLTSENNPIAVLSVNINGENKTTDNNGQISIPLNELTHGEHNVVVKVNSSGYVGEKTVTVTVNSVNTALNMGLSSDNILVGDSVVITADVNATGGSVLFYVNGVLNKTCDVDGASLTLTDLACGNYIVSANFTDVDGNFLNSSNWTSFNVVKKEVTVDVNNLEIDYASDSQLVIIVSYQNELLANLNITVNGVNKTTGVDGKVIIDLSDLDNGEYPFSVKVNTSAYIGEKEVTVTVNPVNTSLNIELTDNNILVGDSVTITAYVNATGGSVLFYVNGVLNKTCDVNGASLTLTDLAYGSYIVSANFTDVNGNFLNSSNETSFDVDKKEVSIYADDLVIDYASDSQLVIIVSYQNELLANLNIAVNGVNKTTDADGKVIIDLNNLANGEHSFSVKVNTSAYIGEKEVMVTVNPVTTVTEITLSNDSVLAGDSITVTANVNATEGNVLFYINGVLNKTCDVNSASLTLSNLAYGSYIVSANFTDADGNYLNSSNETSFNVVKKEVSIYADDLVIDYASDSYLEIIISYQSNVLANLNITVNGANKTTDIDGKVTVGLNNLNKGNYTYLIKVNTSEYAGEKEVNITVNPADTQTEIVLNNNYPIAGGSITINAHVNASGGSMSFYVNGVLNETKFIDTNGNASITLTDLVYGEYNVSANFTGDNYLNSSDKFTFFVNNKNIDVEAYDLTVNYGDAASLVITVTSESSPIADLQVNINGENKTTDGEGKITFLLNELDCGEHNVIIKVNSLGYVGEKTVKVTVNPVKTNLSIEFNDNNILVGDTIVITAHVNATHGSISFYVNGILNKTCDVNSASLTLTDLVYGEYNVSANFTGDNYLNSRDEITFHVNKKEVTITADNMEVSYASNDYLEIILSYQNELLANLNITVNGVNRTADIDGKVTVSLSDLNKGNYNYVINVNTSEYAGEKEVTITVIPATTLTTISLNTSSLLVGDSVTVTASVNVTEGNMLFYVNGVLNEVKSVDSDGNASVTLTDLVYGEYIISANFTGDNYLNSSNEIIFNVNKKEASIDADDLEIKYGSDSQLEIILSYQNDLLVNLNITVNGENKTADGNAKVLIDLNDLTCGEHSIVIKVNTSEYIGEKEVTITVIPATTLTSISLNTSLLVVGDSVTVTASVNVTEGNVLFYVNGVLNETIFIDTNGNASVTLTDLVFGEYIISANFTGNNYLNSSDEVTFKVSKKELDVGVNDTVISYGDETELNVTFTCGNDIVYDFNVSVETDNETVNYYAGNPIMVINLSNLKSGVHNIKISVNTSSYTAEKSVMVSVNPADTKTVLSLNDTYPVGSDVIITANVNASEGKVIFYINNQERQSLDLINNTAVFKLSDVDYGSYNISAVYVESDNFKSSNASSTFTVLKLNPHLSATFKDSTLSIILPDDAKGNLNISTGNYKLTTAVKNAVDVSLASGRHNLVIIYSGDDKYLSDSYVLTVNVENLSLDVDAKSYGENTTVKVTLPSYAKGNVNISVNGTVYQVAINNNVAVLTLNNLNATNYLISATFNKLFDSTSITVPKAKTPITIDASDSYVNQNVLIKITMPLEISGEIIVHVDRDYRVNVNHGNAVVNISSLKANTYSITARYSGDINHEANTTQKQLTIKKLTPNISIRYDEVMLVSISDGATGNVVVNVDGKTYSAGVVNGQSKVNISKLLPGTHIVNVSYSGDGTYLDGSYSSNITVDKFVSILKADNLVKFYKASDKFTFRLTDNSGNSLANESITISVNGGVYTRQTDSNGMASMNINLNSGSYIAELSYKGSSNYKSSSVSANITVLSTTNGSDIVKIFKNQTQYWATFRGSDGKYLSAGTNVTFNINGVLYVRKISDNNGRARLNINLEQGNYILTAVNPVTGENSANNITVLSNIIENSDLTKYYRNASKFTVKVLDEKGSPVKAGVSVGFNVNGVVYQRTTNSEGYVSIAINLQPNTYVITTEYLGCRVSNRITVLPVLSASDLTKKYGVRDAFRAALVDHQGKAYANQHVKFNINGVIYDRITDENGVARLNINLQSGSYIITSSYNGSNIANKVTVVS